VQVKLSREYDKARLAGVHTVILSNEHDKSSVSRVARYLADDCEPSRTIWIIIDAEAGGNVIHKDDEPGIVHKPPRFILASI
jgi:hypothetical protein